MLFQFSNNLRLQIVIGKIFLSETLYLLCKCSLFIAGAQSFLSLASQEELEEVINLLSGASLSFATRADKFPEGSHLTPIDSGIGSLLSVPASSISRASNATLSGTDVNGQAGNTSLPQVQISAAESDISTQTTDAQLTDDTGSQSPKRDTVETQSSPTEVLPPVSFDESEAGVKSDEATQDVSSETVFSETENILPPEALNKNTAISPGSTASADQGESLSESVISEPDKTSTASPSAVEGSNSVEQAEACEETSQGCVETERDSSPDSSSPVLVTVTSVEECDGNKEVSIIESLR